MSKADPPRPARGWGWTEWIPGILCFLIGAWFLTSLSLLVGAVPGEADSRGTATIVSCQRDPVYMWMIYSCEAAITLDGSESDERRVLSTRVLTGHVDVEMAGVTRSTSFVVPANRAHWSFGASGLWFFVVMLPGIFGFTVLGWWVSNRVSRRVPQGPLPLKDFRGVRRLRAGPRRGKRKR